MNLRRNIGGEFKRGWLSPLSEEGSQRRHRKTGKSKKKKIADRRGGRDLSSRGAGSNSKGGGDQGKCGGKRRKDGSGLGRGNRGTKRQPR